MHETPLRRCLTTFDLTLLGFAQMVGAGVFVLTGTVSSTQAGPGVVLSFLVAGIAAFLAALCYAEFGVLLPRTGSAYLFCYAILGEGIAFFAGWCLVAEQMIGIAAVSRALSGSIDGIFNQWIQNKTIETFGRINIYWLNPYPDFLAIPLIFIVHCIVMIGAKSTANMNNLMSIIKVAVLVLISIIGFTKADITNWTNSGTGGFLPFGMRGVFSGAASCFFAFVGFHQACVAGEEAITPRRSIPLSLIITVPCVCILYMLASSSLTLLQPYCDIDELTPFQGAVAYAGMTWARHLITFGTIMALATTLVASVYAMPRIIYAIAVDGLLFSWMGTVNPQTYTPLNVIFTNAILTGTLALFVNMQILVEFYAICNLICFTLVAIALIKFHYQKPDDSPLFQKAIIEDDHLLLLETSYDETGELRPIALKLPLIKTISSIFSMDIILAAMVTYQVAFVMVCTIAYHSVGFRHWYILFFLVVFGTMAFFSFLVLSLHHTNDYNSGFRVSVDFYLFEWRPT